MVNEMQSRMMRAAPTDAMVRANEVVCAMSAVEESRNLTRASL
jgi:hypothetical protein